MSALPPQPQEADSAERIVCLAPSFVVGPGADEVLGARPWGDASELKGAPGSGCARGGEAWG